MPDGRQAVAVIRNPGGDLSAGDIYFDDGTSLSMGNWTSGNASAVVIGLNQSSGVGAFRLDRLLRGNRATFTDLATSHQSTWARCNPVTSSYGFDPQSYSAAANDPYVLPPCDGPWRVPKTQCKDPNDQIIQNGTVSAYFNGRLATSSGGICISLQSQPPYCTGSQPDLVIDAGQPFPQMDMCTDLKNPAVGFSTPLCQSQPVIFGRTPTSGYPVYVSDDQGNTLGGPRPILTPVGPDQCIKEVYLGTSSCPAGATDTNDGYCLVYYNGSSSSGGSGTGGGGGDPGGTVRGRGHGGTTCVGRSCM